MEHANESLRQSSPSGTLILEGQKKNEKEGNENLGHDDGATTKKANKRSNREKCGTTRYDLTLDR